MAPCASRRASALPTSTASRSTRCAIARCAFAMRSKNACASAPIRAIARDGSERALTCDEDRHFAATPGPEMTEPTDDVLRDWLLGKLAPGEAEPLEQRLVEDEAFAAR